MDAVITVSGREERIVSSSRWIARTFVGWVFGFALAIGFLITVESAGLRAVQFPLALGMGLGVGIMQARTLGSRLRSSARWILATTIGLSAPFIGADLLLALGTAVPYHLAAYVALGGVTVGILQWRLLREAEARAWLWLAMTPVGWLLGGSTVWINEVLLPRTPGVIGALAYLAVVLSGGLMLGAAGAVALRLMHGNPPAGRR